MANFNTYSVESLLPFMARDEVEALNNSVLQLIADNAVEGLASPFLYGRNNNWNQNQYLRMAGATNASATAGYLVSAGSTLTRIQIQAGVASPNPVPVYVEVDGVISASLTLVGATLDEEISVVVPDSGSGSARVAIRSGAYAAPRARFVAASLWSVTQ